MAAVAVAAALALHLAALLTHAARAVGGSDTSGYLNTARLILARQALARVDALDALALPPEFAPAFEPLGFVPSSRTNAMAPFYPPGFPLHIAGAVLLLGWKTGPFVVSPVAAGLCLLLMYLLGRELGLSPALAVAGAALLALCPVLIFEGVQPMSDVVATLWSLAAVLLALRARRRAGWGLGAGAALGIAVLVRPTNALIALPVALAFPWRNKRAVALLLAGGLPAAGFLLAWNHAAYGGYFGSGYGEELTHDLRLANFPARFRHYGWWTIVQLSPLLPLGWCAAGFDRRVALRDRLLLLSWFAPIFLFYCCWFPYDQWWYTRFLLPAYPALIAGFLLAARDLAQIVSATASSRRAMVACVTALALAAELRAAKQLDPLDSSWSDSFRDGSASLAALVGPGNAIALSMEFSGALRFYTRILPLRWDRLDPRQFDIIRARATERGYRLFTILLDPELEQARERIPGDWRFLKQIRNATIWEIRPTTTPPAPAGPCRGLATPPFDVCDAAASVDCDARRDDVPHAFYTDAAVPAAELAAQNTGCKPTDDATWRACANAIHLRCRARGCWSTGVGPLEWGAEAASTHACLKTDAPQEVADDDLLPFGGCPSGAGAGAAARFQCAHAVHGFCVSLGFAAGLGPVDEPSPGRSTIVCLRRSHATVVSTSYRALARRHELCTGLDAAKNTPTYCMGAAKRYCIHEGHVAGFGPVADPDGKSPVIVCLDG